MKRARVSYVAGVDLGKSTCRVAVARPDGDVVARAAGDGAPGLADPSGAELGAAAVADAVDRAMTKVIQSDVDVARRGARIDTIVIGAAGVESAAAGATPSLADLVARRCAAANVAVTVDAVTSHAGALGGEPGVVVSAGTGVVAWGLAADGRAHRVDGWGQWIGDEGSGAWIGREALRAVARAHDGRGASTALTPTAKRNFGSVDAIPAALPFGPGLARETAAFVPAVVRCAEGGDDAALDILRRASAHWVEAAVAAARAVGERRVACVGGLAGVELLRDEWRRSLPPELTIVESVGTSTDGAVMLAVRRDLPHEVHIRRYEPGTST